MVRRKKLAVQAFGRNERVYVAATVQDGNDLREQTLARDVQEVTLEPFTLPS